MHDLCSYTCVFYEERMLSPKPERLEHRSRPSGIRQTYTVMFMGFMAFMAHADTPSNGI